MSRSLWSYLKIKELRIEKEDWELDLPLLKKSFFLSVPVAIMNSITAVGVMVLQAGVNSFGTQHIAAYSAGSKIMVLLETVLRLLVRILVLVKRNVS